MFFSSSASRWLIRRIVVAVALQWAAPTISPPSPCAAPMHTTLDAVGMARPGLAVADAEGRWSGLEVEICRAIATAVFGAKARYAYARHDADRLRQAENEQGEVDVAFLTPSEIADEAPGTFAAGPTIFVETHDILVAFDAPATRAADLAMKPVCFTAASPANESLDAWFASRDLPLIRYAFREDDEMYDAYAVQRCEAVVGEATELARARLSGGINHLRSRFLPDHLARFPIVAVTTISADAHWAAIVAATVQALVGTPPAGDDGLGLVADWRAIMLDQVGDYCAIYRRTLGADSALNLDRGVNEAPR